MLHVKNFLSWCKIRFDQSKEVHLENINYDERNRLVGEEHFQQIHAAIDSDLDLQHLMRAEHADKYSTSDIIYRIDKTGQAMIDGWSSLRSIVPIEVQEGSKLLCFSVRDYLENELTPLPFAGGDFFDPIEPQVLESAAQMRKDQIYNSELGWCTFFEAVPPEIQELISRRSLTQGDAANLIMSLRKLLGVPLREESTSGGHEIRYVYVQCSLFEYQSETCNLWRPTSLSAGDSWAYCSANEKHRVQHYEVAGCTAHLDDGTGSLPEMLFSLDVRTQMKIVTHYVGRASEYYPNNLIDVGYTHQSKVLERLR